MLFTLCTVCRYVVMSVFEDKFTHFLSFVLDSNLIAMKSSKHIWGSISTKRSKETGLQNQGNRTKTKKDTPNQKVEPNSLYLCVCDSLYIKAIINKDTVSLVLTFETFWFWCVWLFGFRTIYLDCEPVAFGAYRPL